MKINPVHSLLVIVISSLYLTGCYHDVQPTVTSTQTPGMTSTASASPTWAQDEFPPTVTLPPSPVIPLVSPIPTLTPTPIGRNIFDPFPGEFYLNTVKTEFSVIPAGSVLETRIVADNTLGNIIFTLVWEGADSEALALSLRQPDGTILDLSMEETEDFSHRSDGRSIEYIIDNPQWGEWTMMISNESLLDVPYEIEVYSTADAMRVVLLFDGQDEFMESIDYDEKNYRSGDCIKLTAWVRDLVSLTSHRFYVHGMNVEVTVKDPSNDEYSFKLYDYGLHGDLKADDGIYANYFCNTQTAGEYFFYLQIAGITNWNGGYGVGELPFTREFIRSTTVH